MAKKNMLFGYPMRPTSVTVKNVTKTLLF